MRANSTTCQLKEDRQLYSHCIMLIQKYIIAQRMVKRTEWFKSVPKDTVRSKEYSLYKLKV